MMGFKFLVLTVFMLMWLTLVYSRDTITAMITEKNNAELEDNDVRTVKNHINIIMKYLQTLPEKPEGNESGEIIVKNLSDTNSVCLKPVPNQCFKIDDELKVKDDDDNWSVCNITDNYEETFIGPRNIDDVLNQTSDVGTTKEVIESSCSKLEINYLGEDKNESFFQDCVIKEIIPEKFIKLTGLNKLLNAPATKIDPRDGKYEIIDVTDHVGVNTPCNCSKDVIIVKEIKAYLRPIHHMLRSIHTSLKNQQANPQNDVFPSIEASTEMLENMFNEIRSDIKYISDMIETGNRQNNL